eukprot:ANDGO_08141.mRNA.1 hypothetical protein
MPYSEYIQVGVLKIAGSSLFFCDPCHTPLQKIEGLVSGAKIDGATPGSWYAFVYQVAEDDDASGLVTNNEFLLVQESIKDSVASLQFAKTASCQIPTSSGIVWTGEPKAFGNTAGKTEEKSTVWYKSCSAATFQDPFAAVLPDNGGFVAASKKNPYGCAKIFLTVLLGKVIAVKIVPGRN